MAGITACTLVYNIEYTIIKSERLKENIKIILYYEMDSIMKDLIRLQAAPISGKQDTTSKKLQIENITKMWHTYSKYLPDVYGTKEFESIATFFINLRKINGDISSSQTRMLIDATVKLGKDIIKKFYSPSSSLENEISEKHFNKIINSKNLENLENQVKKIDKKGKSMELLERIKKNPSRIPKDKIPIFIEFVSRKGHIIDNNSMTYDISKVLENLFLRIEDQEKRYNEFKEYIEKNTSLYISLMFILEKGENILDYNQLKQIKKIGINQIQKWRKNGRLLNCYRLYTVLELWNVLGEDQEVIKIFIEECLKNKKKLIQLINGFCYDMHHYSLNGYYVTKEFYFETMEKFIDLKYVKEKVNESEYSKNEHEKLVEEFKIKLEEYISKYRIYNLNSKSKNDKSRFHIEIERLFFKMIGLNNEIVMIEDGRRKGYEYNGTDDKISSYRILKIYNEDSEDIHETFEREEIKLIERFLEIIKKMENYSSNYLFDPSTEPRIRIEAKELCREGVSLAKNILKDERLYDYMLF